MAEPLLPLPHLVTHPTQAMRLVATVEEAAACLSQGYTVVPVDPQQILWLPLFHPRHRLAVVAT